MSGNQTFPSTGSGGGSGAADVATLTTSSDETATLLNSRQWENGTNTTVDLGTAGKISIDASGGGGNVFDTWTTAGRPGTPFTGQAGYNTSTGYVEVYNGSAWGNYTTGSLNPAVSGIDNLAIGAGSLQAATTAAENLAIGSFSLASTLAGINNVAIGNQALAVSTGDRNIAIGRLSGSSLVAGSHNVLIGNSIASGLSSGSENILIGSNSLNNMYIPGAATSNFLNIGNLIYGTDLFGVSPKVGIGTATPDATLTILGDVTVTGTSRIKLPVGSTALRPGTPVAGDLRYNSDTSKFEGYSSSWKDFATQYEMSPKSANFSVTEGTGTYFRVDTSGGAVTASLPVATGSGVVYKFKATSAAFDLTLDPSGAEVIDNAGDVDTTLSVTNLDGVVELVDAASGIWDVT
jgi:hypothetical protein